MKDNARQKLYIKHVTFSEGKASYVLKVNVIPT